MWASPHASTAAASGLTTSHIRKWDADLRSAAASNCKLPVTTSAGSGRRPQLRFAMGASTRTEEAAPGADAMPDSYVWPEETRPSVAHDVFQVDLPVVDLAPVFELEKLVAAGGAPQEELEALQAQKQAVLQQIKAGCEEYGFFQVVNHGVAAQVVDEVVKAGLDFFARPSEVKQIAADGSSPFLGYTSMSKTIPNYPAFRWHEGLGLPPHWEREKLDSTAERLAKAGFGTGLDEESIKSLLTDFGSQTDDLAMRLMELLAESLGLSKDFFAREFRSRNESIWRDYFRYYTRFNYYPRCPRPDLALGVPGHTDPGLLTVLYQDSIGGLQILTKDGQKWLGVKPVPGAFVINAGDILQLWSNDRLLSSEHRVVTNDKSGRLSIAVFFNPHNDTNIAIPQELVDEQHPVKFRPLKADDFFKLIAPLGTRGREHLTRHFRVESVPAGPA